MSELLARLSEEVLPDAPWEAIAPHFARGVVVLVRGTTLPEAGAALAVDDVDTVQHWLEKGILHRPNDDDAKAWNAENATFDMLVVQPWILIRHQDAKD